MNKIGIIGEYNPFHNGHIYHINKIKELYPDSIIVLILSGNFTQRGIPSIIDKFDKTEITLKYGIDLVVELPFVYATQSADIFAYGAISLLKELKVDTLVFGSESNDIDNLVELAHISLSKEYEKEVKKYIDTNSYPTALNMAFKKFNKDGIKDPNDLLGLSYIKEILKQKADIKPISIKRTNDYHSKELKDISSATSIRLAIKENKNRNKSIPLEVAKSLKKNIYSVEQYFPLLKYKILSTSDLSIYQTVTLELENRLKKEIVNATNWDDLIDKVKTKHYTYNRISRMLIHILCEFTKEIANSFKRPEYIRVLGFSKEGKNYLNKIKKDVNLPIITTFSKGNSKMLELEKKTSDIYYSIKDNSYLKKEYQEKVKRS